MTRYYGHPIEVSPAPGAGADGADGADAAGSQPPQRFRWRARTFVVAELLGAWRLRDRWWLAPSSSGHASATPPRRSDLTPQATAASDRSYYRLTCVGGMQCDIYYDAPLDQWFLDRVYD